MAGHWTITLGDGRRFHERDWAKLHMDERQRLLVANPGSRTDFIRAAVCCGSCEGEKPHSKPLQIVRRQPLPRIADL